MSLHICFAEYMSHANGTVYMSHTDGMPYFYVSLILLYSPKVAIKCTSAMALTFENYFFGGGEQQRAIRVSSANVVQGFFSLCCVLHNIYAMYL